MISRNPIFMSLTVVLTTEKQEREAEQLLLTGRETMELLEAIHYDRVFDEMKDLRIT